MPTRTTTVEICGVEHEVEVEFTVRTFGTADSYFEPGDPPEIEVDRVVYTDDPTERDISGLLSELRDLYVPTWPMSGAVVCGYGFEVQHGYYVGDPLRPLDRRHVPPKVTFNKGRSILEAIEEEIYSNLHEYEGGDYDWDHDY